MKLTDYNTQMPRLKLEKPLETRELVRYINERSGFVASDVVGMLYELRDVLLNHLQNAKPVRLESLGIFSPSMRLDGSINIRFRPSKEFLKDLNAKTDTLTRRASNRKNIGKTLQDLAALPGTE